MTAVNERRAKDLITDCYNLWTKWNELHTKSLSIVQLIGNKRILLMDPESSLRVDANFDVDECRNVLTTACEKLRDTLHEFNRIVRKMDKIRTNFDSLRTLLGTNGVQSETATIFVSWSVDRVLDAIVVVHEQLKDEFKCKSVVFDTLPFADDRQTIEICTTSWAHQPYLDENRINFFINAIAKEAGLI